VAIAVLSHNPGSLTAKLQMEELADCQRLAVMISQCIKTPIAIALSGTLGAGKTQWTRFFAMALGAPSESISSPTFMLVHEYPCLPKVYHLDAYRIGDEDEMLELGVEEMFESDSITIIEWADRFPSILPRNTLKLHFEVCELEFARVVELSATGNGAKAIWNEVLLCIHPAMSIERS